MDANDSLRDAKVLATSMYVIVGSSIAKLVIKAKLHTEIHIQNIMYLKSIQIPCNKTNITQHYSVQSP